MNIIRIQCNQSFSKEQYTLDTFRAMNIMGEDEMHPSTIKKDTLTVYKMMWKYIDETM